MFERLTYFTFVQNPAARCALCSSLGLEEYEDRQVEAALWKEHHAIFEDWLCMSLERKLADLEEYSSRQDRSLVEVALGWFDPISAQRLIPRGAQAPEIRLFQNDVELLLRIIVPKRGFPES